MSNERRRKARIQGGWASQQKPFKSPSSARSDDSKPSVSEGKAWLGKIVDRPSTTTKFVFQDPTEDCKERPPDKVITKPGVFDISETANGISRLRFFPDFIERKDADWYYDQLYQELPWRQRSEMRKGESHLQPRLTAWFGDVPYSYSGVTHETNPQMPPALQLLKDRLEESTGYKFNSLLANLYRDGHDSVGWHSDDEPALGPQPTIASLSFGDTRNFELRQKLPDKDGNYDVVQHVRIPLTHGSLLIMEGAMQDDWQHRIPVEYHDRQPRINLTFRVIFPE